jgi:hypothetical protein
MGVGNHLRGTSAYVNVDGKDVVYVTDTDDFLWRYTVRDLDPANDTWELIGRRPMTGHRGEGAAAIDTANNIFLHGLTEDSFGFWDLDHPGDADQNREIRVVPTVVNGTPAPDFRDFGVDCSSTLAMRVCQPGPVAFQEAITWGGNRRDRSCRGCCSLGRPRRTSFLPW